MQQYRLMIPDFLRYNNEREIMCSHPLYINSPRPVLNSIDDTLDLISSDIGVVQSFYDTYLPEREEVPAGTKLLIENSQQRIMNREKQQELDNEIKAMEMRLTPGQVVFHAGTSSLPDYISEPLSTSFSPTKAYMNAIHNYKALRAGELVLHCLTVRRGDLPVYVYPEQDRDEFEVLFSSGIYLKNITEYKKERIEYGFGLSEVSDKKINFIILKAELCCKV